MDCKINKNDNAASFKSMVSTNCNTSKLDTENNDLTSTVNKTVCWQPSLITKVTSSTASDLLPKKDNAVIVDTNLCKGKKRWRSAAETVIRQLRTRLLTEPLSSAPLSSIVDSHGHSEDKGDENTSESNYVQNLYNRKAAGSTSSLFDPWHDFLINCIPVEVARRYRFSSLHQRWVIDEVRVKIEPAPFDHGAMRECFRMKKLPNNGTHRNDWRYASNYVAKRYINPETERNVYFEDVRLQMEAKLWAERFNRCNPPKKVDVFQMCILEFHHRDAMPLYHIERYMDGTYKKYNSNSGFVDETSCRNTPQVFSHFTFEHSCHKLLIVDIQGVDDLYTDPQIHTSDAIGYGDGNLGPRGMALFFHSHRCNPICEYLGLTEFQLAPSELSAGILEESSNSQEQEFKKVNDWDLMPSSNDEDEGDKGESTSLLEMRSKMNDFSNAIVDSPKPSRLRRTRCFSTGDQGTQVRYGTGVQFDWRPLQHVYLNHPPTDMLIENSYYCSFESILNATQSSDGARMQHFIGSHPYEESGFSEGDELERFPQDDLETMLSDFGDSNKTGDHPIIHPPASTPRRMRGISTCSEDIDCIASAMEEKEENWPPHAVEWLRNKSPSIPPHAKLAPLSSVPVRQIEHCQPHYPLSQDDKYDVVAKVHYELGSLHANGRFRALDINNDIDWNAVLFHIRLAARLGCLEAQWEMACFAEPRSRLLELGNCVPPTERLLYQCVLSPNDEDEENAWEYIRQVAYKARNLKAMYAYARICESGNQKISQMSDLGEALRWYKRAISASESQDLSDELPSPSYEIYAHMAQLYMEGGPCLQKDCQKAGDLYTEAAESATAAMKGRIASKYFALAEECYAAVDD